MMENYNIQEYKAKVLDVLKYSMDFFKKHNINWYIACGSAIGTVRHKGFIPWDDDIDVYMPRPDYNHLISVRDEMKKDGYEMNYIGDDGYYLPFAKISSMNTTVIESKSHAFVLGCNIDVFPLDITNQGMMSFSTTWKNYFVRKGLLQAKYAPFDIAGRLKAVKNGHNGALIGLALKPLTLFGKKQKYKKALMQFEQNYYQEEGDRYVSFTENGMYMFPKVWFDEFTMAPFEDVYVRLPKHYHEYLTYMYGDYMTPPPIEKRMINYSHQKYYVNLNERVDFREAVRRKKTKK